MFFDCAPALVGVCKTANSYLEHIDVINDIKNLKLDWLVPNSSTCLSDLKDTVKYLNEPKEFFGKKIFKKYKERNKVLQKYLYSNEYFSIVIPESPIDMIKESFVLRNCLREYVRDHANGKTNILFLRRNKSLDESFYAIQLSNKGKIKQVHGKSNCNAKDTPHVKKFIKEWARVKKLHGKDYDDLY